ncbi:hypothetical protein MUK70_15230 [Dyadobacter chenwenxiniae]|uniref:Uncharacterized protein n=1 Tax=Dyadobacter chenwenxiniae TaxID=2906456 RepID=A0A9X1TDP6_9BACT|nr:hypothetical protein [Dyadobacter chenwenxiniae]MCF0051605.1 hypothetical protein [Dyadobacter chenwenxiniae]MCF0060595.1 hypothetical protein [Dyadobacter chenwenxiniae]UON86326.1 hypothetical protein MUK70_15230 [Dyadobacter chenwenxiniae]
MMKNAFLLMVLFLTITNLYAQKGEVLSNNNIVAMHQAKVSKSLIIQKINASTARFDMSVPGMLALESVKVPEAIMEVMLTASKPADVLQNEQIIQMHQAGFSKRLIIQRIQAGPNRFNVTTDGLIQLRIAKVPEAITKVMINGNSKSK